MLWRSEDAGVIAWADRCPHRSVRLSGGTIVQNTLVCPYHGLAFNAQGQCVKVPAHPITFRQNKRVYDRLAAISKTIKVT